MDEFELGDQEYIELSNLLKVTGLSDSGGMAKVLITEGYVTVDGEVELRKRCKLRKGQVVAYDGQEIEIT
jgi:ribosome-associated protein